MRLGGPVSSGNHDPEEWIAALRREGYRAAVCPLEENVEETAIREYRLAAERHDIRIAEVGAWSNPISPDEDIRRQALAYCKRRLHLADLIGARCCVNISGSRSMQWDGPHPDNFGKDTFALIVDTVREIIDEVEPSAACFTLETMPWALPDSADAYLALLKAIDRKAFAVHFDPVNLIASPRTYYRNGDMIRDFVAKLGPWIVGCHAKDIVLDSRLTVHLSETAPGQGALDYAVLLRELHRLNRDIPVILEHLSSEEEYRRAAAYVRSVASAEGIKL